MSGIRKCDECSELFKITNAGPEAMRVDGTFPRHVCLRCHYLKEICNGLQGIVGARTFFSKSRAGRTSVFIVAPHEGKESRVLEIRWKDKDRLVADVCEEESGKMLHDEVLFTPGQEDVLEPLLMSL